MSSPRADLVDLPFWPLFLTKSEAARYVGVNTRTFLHEVAAGIWPPPLPRDTKGRRPAKRLTWYRPTLDIAAAQFVAVTATVHAKTSEVLPVSDWMLTVEDTSPSDETQVLDAVKPDPPAASADSDEQRFDAQHYYESDEY